MPVITTNTAANSALRYLNINSSEQTNALNKVASGSRITRASDDAAGLAVATKLQADVGVLGQASTNASHGQSVLETADGALSSIASILERMKVLAAESMDGALSDTERGYASTEYSDLNTELTSVISQTKFNNQALLSGYSASFLVGTSNTDTISFSLSSLSLGLSGTSVGSSANASTALGSLDAAISNLASMQASVGAYESQFNYRTNVITNSRENMDAAQSAIADCDVAEAQSEFSSAQVKTNAAIAALAQANSMPQQLLSLLQ